MIEIQINTIKDISAIESLDWHEIASNNWHEYPAQPKTKFKIAKIGDSIHIKFLVEESNPRKVNTEDQMPVWEDSCVEFFCKTADDDHYLNFEFNSLGACVSSRRLGRKEDVVKLSPEELSQIKRTPKIESDHWTLSVEIPISLIERAGCDPKVLFANFYKCGDKTENPHYLSWSPINLPKPDFHCPAFFGKLTLQ